MGGDWICNCSLSTAEMGRWEAECDHSPTEVSKLSLTLPKLFLKTLSVREDSRRVAAWLWARLCFQHGAELRL